jgi:hypothetical protein
MDGPVFGLRDGAGGALGPALVPESRRARHDDALPAGAPEGRVSTVRFGPRTLDVDILLYGTLQVDEPDLSIPHPRMNERRFALAPLVEIAADLSDPRDGRRFAEVLAGLDEGKKVLKSTTRES